MKLGDKVKKPVKGNPSLGILNSLGDEDDDLSKNGGEISTDLLVFNEMNFYNQNDNEEDIRELADSIKEIGLLHNIVIKPNGKGQYTIISGEKRTKAYRLLYEETKDDKYLMIPCKIRHDINSAADEEITLIRANRDVRERNDVIKAKEVERLYALYEGKKAAGERVGTIRKRISEDLGISETQVQRFKQVNELIPEFKQMLNTGEIQLTTVEHFTEFEPDVQKDIYESLLGMGHRISREEAKEIKTEIKSVIDTAATEDIISDEHGVNDDNSDITIESGQAAGAENPPIPQQTPQPGGKRQKKDTSKKDKENKDVVAGVKSNVDIAQHIKKALNSMKSLAAKLDELAQNKKKLTPEHKAAINSIKEILDSLSL